LTEIIIIIVIFIALWGLGIAFMNHDMINISIEKFQKKYQKAIKVFINLPLIGLIISCGIILFGLICGVLIVLLYPIEKLSNSFKK